MSRLVSYPLTKDILDDPLATLFRTLTNEYDGMTNPHDHLNRFESGTSLLRYSKRVKFRAFLTTHTNSAQTWFGQLPLGFAQNFEEISTLFLHQVSSARKIIKISLSFICLNQGAQKSLRDYVTRFNKVALNVPSAEIKINALAQGLQDRDFFKSFAKRLPNNF